MINFKTNNLKKIVNNIIQLYTVSHHLIIYQLNELNHNQDN